MGASSGHGGALWSTTPSGCGSQLAQMQGHLVGMARVWQALGYVLVGVVVRGVARMSVILITSHCLQVFFEDIRR